MRREVAPPRRQGPPPAARPVRRIELDHDVYYFALDLDELDEVDPVSSGSSAATGRTSSRFRDGDHLDPPADDLAADVRPHLRDEGVDPEGWRITLVTNLRVFGYVFNPASFYLCRDRGRRARVVVVEVHNTHGERHLYTLRPDARASARHVATMDKDFYVSPFIEMEGRYTVRVRDEADRPADRHRRGRATGRRCCTRASCCGACALTRSARLLACSSATRS